MSVREWFKEAVEPSLLMSFLLVTLGTAVAASEGYFNAFYYILAVIGVTLSQNAVNVLNDYDDYKTGVDAKTMKTPFSGGSKYLVSGAIRPESAFSFGLASLLLAVPIGVYFVILRGVPLLAIAAIAGLSVCFYTNAFARVYLGEFLAGLNLGPLAIIGACYVQTGTLTLGAVLVGVAPGIMIANVLFLNELPDMAADAAGGRRNLPILLGGRRAVKFYAILEAFAVAWTPAMALLGLIPVPTAIALFAAPFAGKAIRVALHNFSTVEKLIPGLGANIITAYVTIALLSVGYMISKFVGL
jgi:1,4-dihydroxy-2-naphthoate octaprenyltransferase